MNYSPKEILSFVEENDVKFIRLTFTDIYGQLKNIAIMPDQLSYAALLSTLQPSRDVTPIFCFFRIYQRFQYCRGVPNPAELSDFSVI